MPDLTAALANATMIALAAASLTGFLLPATTTTDTDVLTRDPEDMPIGPIIENGTLL